MPSPLGNPIEPRALVDEVARRLEEAIVTGQLAPGSRLSEQAISSALGVSRGPLREAIRRLEARRLLQRTPYAGVTVVDLSVEDLDQIMVTREALEGMTCRQAAENMTLAEVRDLRACVEEEARLQREALERLFTRGPRDMDFHVRIARGSRNRWLAAVLCEDLYSLLRVYRFRSASLGSRGAEAMAEHHEIVDAIERRDPDLAEALMRAHIRRARQNLVTEARRALEARTPPAIEPIPRPTRSDR